MNDSRTPSSSSASASATPSATASSTPPSSSTESPSPTSRPASPGATAPIADGFRIGQGYDVHALVPGRPLIIGGVSIPHTHGLLGHSDADVLLHAITDALLGAAGLGDIGRMFPDTDPAYRGADSLVLLRQAMARVAQAGWRVVNVDATVIAQAPRLAPHVAAMQRNIAEALGCSPAVVNVKGKTSELLGFVGRREGIVAHTAVLLGARGG